MYGGVSDAQLEAGKAARRMRPDGSSSSSQCIVLRITEYAVQSWLAGWLAGQLCVCQAILLTEDAVDRALLWSTPCIHKTRPYYAP